MSTQMYVSGPTYVQVGTGAEGALQHLGWSDGGISVEQNAEYEDVMCDLGGGRIGTDVIYQGQDAIITADLNRYDETVLNALLARIQGATAGTIGVGQIGTLMNTQAASQRLLVVSPYAALTAYSGSMTAAYNFVSTYTLGAIRMDLGTKVKKVRIVWRAIPVWSVTSGGLSTGALWNNSVSGAATPA